MTSHVTRLLLAQHVLFTNIWSDDSGCFVDLCAPSLTKASISIHMCRIKFCPDWKKKFFTPFDVKSMNREKYTRQM